MSKIQFRLAARTDAAGKYNPNAPLEGNEDNMFVDSNLAKGNQGEFNADAVVNLSEKGCLMVVADGMGGMNAGEVASDIAIKTVMEYFTPERLTDSIIRDSGSRMRYMENVVVAADDAIKKDSTSNPEHEGMGSTIIMAWLCNDEICLTWCGDSRAYLFRPGQGFKQVSKDHSYVQGLVDEGKITEVEAFDHPYGNVIMRSLGDPEKKAEPESRCFKVNQGDIFMLCSDGLSGVLRDRKTYNANGERLETENLEDIIAAHRDSMAECRDCLFEAAQRNDWYDNVTAILCEIVKTDGAPSAPSSPNAYAISSTSTNSTNRKKYLLYVFIALIAFGLGLILALKIFHSNQSPKEEIATSVKESDTVPVIDTTREQLSEVIEETKEGVKEEPKPEPQKPIVKKEEPKPEPQKPIVKKEEPEPEPQKPIVKKEEPEPKPKHNEETINVKHEAPIVPDNNNPGQATSSGEESQKPTTNQRELSASSNQKLDRGTESNATVAPKQNLSEEEMFKSINTIEDCCVYVETFGKKNKKHLSEVKKKFYSLYQEKCGQEIKTKEGCETFLIEHDVLMKRMGFTDTEKKNYIEFKKSVENKLLGFLNNRAK